MTLEEATRAREAAAWAAEEAGRLLADLEDQTAKAQADADEKTAALQRAIAVEQAIRAGRQP